MAAKFELFITFAKIGAFTFGGGYAMIALIENECVSSKKWISHDEFMDMAVIAEATPGPIAINCATYVGYKKAGVPGALAATFGVVLPSFLIILFLSTFFDNLLQFDVVRKAFCGIRAAVALLIIRAGVSMLQKMLKTKDRRPAKMIFSSLFFAVVLLLNFLNRNISILYLIAVSGIMGFFVFRPGEEKK